MTYTYLFADLVTGTIIEELPLSGVEYEIGLNGSPGALTASLPIDGALLPQRILDATIPRRTCVYVDRDGVLVWGGIVWTRKPATSSNLIPITASELSSYFARIYITDDLVFTGVDQNAIIRALLGYAQGKAGANLGIESTDTTGTSGITRDVTYERAGGTSILAAWQALSELESGPDFTIQPAYSGGRIVRQLLIGAPTLGQAYASSGYVFEYGGNVRDLEHEEDASSTVNVAIGFGGLDDSDTSTTPVPSYTSTDSTFLTRGEPRLEAVSTDSTLKTLEKIEAVTDGVLAAQGGLIASGSWTQFASADPGVAVLDVGDEGRLRIAPGARAAFPSGLDLIVRVSSIKVQVSDDGDDTMTVGYGALTGVAG